MLDPTDPWNTSWQAYWTGYGLWLVLVWILVWLTRRRGRPGTLPTPLPELRTEHLAYLYGGGYRVAETVVARLLSQRRLRARNRDGTSTIVGRFRTDARGLAARALEATDMQPQRPGDLLGILKRSAEMSRVVEELRGYGLVSSAGTRALRKWGPHALLLAWLLVGVARLVALRPDPPGTARPAQMAQIVVLVFVLSVVGFAFAALFEDDSGYLTRTGAAVVHALDQARENAAGHAGTEQVLARYGPLLQGAEGAVVVAGLDGYPDPDVVSALHSRGLERGGGGV